MPEVYNELSDRLLAVGDVMMVSRQMRDKTTKKSFLWKFFIVLSAPDDGFGDIIEGYVVGTTNQLLKDRPMRVFAGDEKNVIHYLPIEEWPDGVHAFRMALVMQRKIDL